MRIPSGSALISCGTKRGPWFQSSLHLLEYLAYTWLRVFKFRSAIKLTKLTSLRLYYSFTTPFLFLVRVPRILAFCKGVFSIADSWQLHQYARGSWKFTSKTSLRMHFLHYSISLFIFFSLGRNEITSSTHWQLTFSCPNMPRSW